MQLKSHSNLLDASNHSKPRYMHLTQWEEVHHDKQKHNRAVCSRRIQVQNTPLRTLNHKRTTRHHRNNMPLHLGLLEA